MSKEAARYLEVDPWRIVERGFHPDRSLVSESLFSLGNEYQGVRAYFEEGYSGAAHVGAFFNGVYEYRPIEHPTGREFKGMVHRTHFMVNGPDWLSVRLRGGGETLDLDRASITDFERSLDLSTGELVRSFVWKTTAGRIRLVFRRFLSFDDARVGFQRIEAEALDGPVAIEIDFLVDFGTVHQEAGRCFWELEAKGFGDQGFYAVGRTVASGQRIACFAELTLPSGVSKERIEDGARVGLRVAAKLAVGAPLAFIRRAVNHAERDAAVDRADFFTVAQAAAAASSGATYEAAAAAAARHWRGFWDGADIEIAGDPENQQGIRFCLFHLHQAYRGVDPTLNVSAKGLTGEAYCGWAWWDTETYCLPFYLFSDPAAARNLLGYRHWTMAGARKRALELDCAGARYPMATINGDEAVGVWQHADLEIHVSGAVFYGIRHYVESTGDRAFLFGEGIEVLIEVCRFYSSRGAWSPLTGEFGFWGVMGPDEFAMMVHNNCYTNVLAKKGFEYTIAVLDELGRARPERLRELEAGVAGGPGLRADERADWADKARRMRIPYDPATGVYEQHDGFFDLPHIDAGAVPPADFPLYKHWAYVRIFPNDLIKQPDVLLLQFLFNGDYSAASKRANFAYYEPRCIHESSLSPGIHAVLAAELGMEEKAGTYVGHAFRLDLDDYNRNTDLGVHTTSMAAAWMAITYGYGGMRTDGPMLAFAPRLPRRWERLRFSIAYRGRAISVELTPTESVFRLRRGEPLRIVVHGTDYVLERELRIPASTGRDESGTISVTAVIFDLDGVLVSTDDFHYLAWKRIADEEGIPFDREINHRLRGVGRMESLAIILERASRPYAEAERISLAERKNAYYRESLTSGSTALSPANVLPGAVSLLDELASRGVKVAVGSSSANAPLILERTALAARFPVVIDGSMLRRGKPDPQVFNLAAARLGVVPGECVVVEDAAAGLEAARRAGMRAFAVGAAVRGPALDAVAVDELLRA